MKPEAAPDRWRGEAVAVAVATLFGSVLRLWPPGRLGLTHFDEGIYALAAGWALDPRGLAALDPILIPYAPPGFPILAGLAYGMLGASDGSILLVSWLAGTLTIPVVAWLGRRTFGPGAGIASATLAALSGPHLAFSRMALTDVSFLLAWLLAIGMGMRFLERPGGLRAVGLGLGVGLAQQFKYNGWLVGAIVGATAGLGLLVGPEARRPQRWARTFGWGGVAAGVAWLVVRPWFHFVEAHGGYADLLRHQRSYLGGFRDWWPHLRVQAEQAIALLTGPGLAGLGVALIALIYFRARPGGQTLSAPVVVGAVGIGIAARIFDAFPPWLGLILAPGLLTSGDASIRLAGIWWLTLAVLSPFYHPYARLWLPLQAVNWLLIGGLVAGVARGVAWPSRLQMTLGGTAIVAGGIVFGMGAWSARPQPDLLGPSDSLRRAASRVASILPDEAAGLLVLVRPPVAYYLAGRVAMIRLAGSESLLGPGPPRAWALVDSAILRSESGGPVPNLPASIAKHWEVVEEIPSTMALPTLLDVDPGAARGTVASRSAPLWLLRPRTPGSPP